jgi:hypothetical protein
VNKTFQSGGTVKGRCAALWEVNGTLRAVEVKQSLRSSRGHEGTVAQLKGPQRAQLRSPVGAAKLSPALQRWESHKK